VALFSLTRKGRLVPFSSSSRPAFGPFFPPPPPTLEAGTCFSLSYAGNYRSPFKLESFFLSPLLGTVNCFPLCFRRNAERVPPLFFQLSGREVVSFFLRKNECVFPPPPPSGLLPSLLFPFFSPVAPLSQGKNLINGVFFPFLPPRDQQSSFFLRLFFLNPNRSFLQYGGDPPPPLPPYSFFFSTQLRHFFFPGHSPRRQFFFFFRTSCNLSRVLGSFSFFSPREDR